MNNGASQIEVDKSKVEEVTTKNSAMEKLSLARRKTGADTPDEFKDVHTVHCVYVCV